MSRGAFSPVVLCVLDGFGLAPPGPANAVSLARMPVWRELVRTHPYTELAASGGAVGLPDGEMGNSEVGHLTMGAGRVVPQTRLRLDRLVAEGRLGELPGVDRLVAAGRAGRLHLMGLLGPGGVHAESGQVHALLDLLAREGAQGVRVHLFLDGRDTPPRSALGYLEALGPHLPERLGRVATVAGRYYAMDRDRRWERTEAAYRAVVEGVGLSAPDAAAAVAAAYARGEDDEFVRPTVVGPPTPAQAGDLFFFWNFRADRARQLSRAVCDPAFSAFPRPKGTFPLITLVAYADDLPAEVLMGEERVGEPVGEVVAAAGLTQLRAAETEKYAHVTYFFNGGREEPFPGERRRLVPSLKVATYDLAPEMAARGITDAVLAELEGTPPHLVVMNYANPDMVGHTGNLEATVQALEVLDGELGRLARRVAELGGALLITADHGNAEKMRDPETGQPHTAHTTSPVPAVLVAPGLEGRRLAEGQGLASVGVTLLALMGLAPSLPMDAPPLLDVQRVGG